MKPALNYSDANRRLNRIARFLKERMAYYARIARISANRRIAKAFRLDKAVSLKGFGQKIRRWHPAKGMLMLRRAAAPLIAGGMLAFALSTTPAHAATIVVNSTADAVMAGNGQCTLREALNNANESNGADTTGGDCASGTGSGPDTVQMTGLTGTVVLVADLPTIMENVSFLGPGAASLAVDGNNHAAFRTQTAADIDLEFEGLTISNTGGSGIDATGSVTVVDSVVSGNGGTTCTGIYGKGPVSVSGSTVSDNGFNGIFTNGNLTIENSTITGNGGSGTRALGSAEISDSTVTGNVGSGVYSYGDMTVTDSTVSGNGGTSYTGIFSYGTVDVSGSTISGSGWHGIYTDESVTVVNSTISGNAKNGVSVMGNADVSGSTLDGNDRMGIYAAGDLSVVDSTVSGNGGTSYTGLTSYGIVTVTGSTISGSGWHGIYTDESVTVVNSTISGNAKNGVSVMGNADANNSTFADNGQYGIYARDGGTLENSIVAGKNDGEADIAGGLGSGGHNLIGNADGFTTAGSDIAGIDPKIGPLANNGGDTATHALLEGSRAIGGGDDATATATDQRGEPKRGVRDIGAFEYQGTNPDNPPDKVGADSFADVFEQTFDVNDGDTDLADLTITEGSGPGTLTVELFETGCQAASVGFCWDAFATGDFTGNLTLYYGGLDLKGMDESELKAYHWNGDSWDDLGGEVNTQNHTITIAGLTQDNFSPFTLNTSTPLLVELADFSATYGNDGTILAWETASETDNAGFHIWRSDGKDEEYVRITETLIPAKGDEVSGASYSYVDSSASGTGFRYWLEDFDYSGKSDFHSLSSRYASLGPGWNFLAGDALAGQSAAAALASIEGRYYSVWGMSNGAWKMFAPDKPEFSGLETFEAGVSYFIDVREACILALP